MVEIRLSGTGEITGVEEMSTTTINITPEMEKWKRKFPAWRDGGPNWDKITAAGIFRWRQAYKFGDSEELHDNVEKHLKVT